MMMGKKNKVKELKYLQREELQNLKRKLEKDTFSNKIGHFKKTKNRRHLS
jgi:hypothetical protein